MAKTAEGTTTCKGYHKNIESVDYATNALYATHATNADEATHATTADSATNATNATDAETAETLAVFDSAWQSYTAGETIEGGVFLVRAYNTVSLSDLTPIYAVAILDTCGGTDTYVSGLLPTAAGFDQRICATHSANGYFTLERQMLEDANTGWTSYIVEDSFEYKRIHTYSLGIG